MTTPSLLGAVLLVFVVGMWAVAGELEPSGTTSTALVVAAALILVPAIVAGAQGTSITDHAQEVFEMAQDLLEAPESEDRPRQLR